MGLIINGLRGIVVEVVCYEGVFCEEVFFGEVFFRISYDDFVMRKKRIKWYVRIGIGDEYGWEWFMLWIKECMYDI